MLACVIVTLVFVLFVAFSLFVRKKSLARLAAAGKLEGMDEALLLEEFGVPARRLPDTDPELGRTREILEFEIPGAEPVRVFVDPQTRTVTGSASGPIPDDQNPGA